MGNGKRHGLSFGSVVVLALTGIVLIAFTLMLSTFMGQKDFLSGINEIVIAIDDSVKDLISGSSSVVNPNTTQNGGFSALPVMTKLESTSAPTPTIAPKRRFSLSAVGSVIWNSSTRKLLTVSGQPAYEILTDQIEGALRADVSFAVLENTLIDSMAYSDVNQPSDILQPLVNAGINCLCVGHLNILNAGLSGLAKTMQSIESAGMQPFGLRSSADESTVIIERQGVKIALLHFQDELSGTGRNNTSEAERSLALSPISIDVISEAIQSSRSSGAQVIIVSLCWGRIGADEPTDTQKQLAQQIANAGADVILGTHSGVVQPLQVLSADRGDGKYHPVLCAYSLGSLYNPDRTTRATISGLRLNATVVYDAQTDCVAFEGLSYMPTYAWQGKQDNVTLTRILLNDGTFSESFLDSKQRGVMERSFQLIQSVMENSGIPMAQ